MSPTTRAAARREHAPHCALWHAHELGVRPVALRSAPVHGDRARLARRRIGFRIPRAPPHGGAKAARGRGHGVARARPNTPVYPRFWAGRGRPLLPSAGRRWATRGPAFSAASAGPAAREAGAAAAGTLPAVHTAPVPHAQRERVPAPGSSAYPSSRDRGSWKLRARLDQRAHAVAGVCDSGRGARR